MPSRRPLKSSAVLVRARHAEEGLVVHRAHHPKRGNRGWWTQSSRSRRWRNSGPALGCVPLGARGPFDVCQLQSIVNKTPVVTIINVAWHDCTFNVQCESSLLIV